MLTFCLFSFVAMFALGSSFRAVKLIPRRRFSALNQLLKNNHPKNNIPDGIIEKVGRNLHLKQNHPLNMIKKRIEQYCNNYAQKNNQAQFKIFDDLSPIVNTKQCFDDLRVPPEHVSRRPSDTYYVDDNTVLRTHTSAHQTHFISQGVEAFLCTGDVYRRDEIDSSHYPVFHQMEGVRIFPESAFPPNASPQEVEKIIEDDLKNILTGLAKELFGETELRWNAEYFPFTEPSFELEVNFRGQWLEVLGCGVIHKDVLAVAGQAHRRGWAFGLGLERLAMVLFEIPDIRLFWSTDERFTSQFEESKPMTKFRPYSKYPACYKDVSFWLPAGDFHSNDVYEVIRSVAGDIVESVVLFDSFENKKSGKVSHAYRINYRHMDRSLTNAEVDEMQWRVREALTSQLKVELR